MTRCDNYASHPNSACETSFHEWNASSWYRLRSQLSRRSMTLILVVLTILSLQLSATGQDAIGKDPRESLPPDVRKQFDEAYARYKEAKTSLAAIQKEIAAQDPLLVIAKREREEGQDVKAQEATKLRVKVEDYERSLPTDEVRKRYRRWADRFGTVQKAEWALQCAADPKCRPFLSGLAHQLIQRYSRRDRQPELLKEVLPVDASNLAPEQALDVYLRWCELTLKQARPELKELEVQVNVPQFVSDYVRDTDIGSVKGTMYQLYIDSHDPRRLSDAQEKVVDAHNQLTKIWPEWEKAMKEGVYEYLKTANRGETREQRLPVGQPRRALWLLGIALLVIFMIVFARRWPQSASA